MPHHVHLSIELAPKFDIRNAVKQIKKIKFIRKEKIYTKLFLVKSQIVRKIIS